MRLNICRQVLCCARRKSQIWIGGGFEATVYTPKQNKSGDVILGKSESQKSFQKVLVSSFGVCRTLQVFCGNWPKSRANWTKRSIAVVLLLKVWPNFSLRCCLILLCVATCKLNSFPDSQLAWNLTPLLSSHVNAFKHHEMYCHEMKFEWFWCFADHSMLVNFTPLYIEAIQTIILRCRINYVVYERTVP